ncbi:hypothetical protein WJ968_12975 [Achromobacter xylosoxidans]
MRKPAGHGRGGLAGAGAVGVPVRFWLAPVRRSGCRADAGIRRRYRETWLHFAPEARLPAILGVDEEGERPLPHTRRAPYVVLPGVWPELRFQGGGLRATALRNQEPGGSVREGLHCRQPSI